MCREDNPQQRTRTGQPDDQSIAASRERRAEAAAALQAAMPRAESDPKRPLYHFRPPSQWMNDPNGTIYYRGHYHLFYQLNPFDSKWGNIHWGHAQSRDLVNWEHLPIALYPSGEMGEEHCFSGCCTLSEEGAPVILYTSIGPHQGREKPEQWAALGDEEMLRWRKHPDNPILTQEAHGPMFIAEWRDPFVFSSDGRLYLILGGKMSEEAGADPVVALYEAETGKLDNWRYRGILFRHPDKNLRSIECPNLVHLGETWLLLVSPCGPVQYFAGDINLKRPDFNAHNQGLVDHSSDFYATNIFRDDKERCILVGWVRNFHSPRGWNGCLSLPRLIAITDDGQLKQQPPPELSSLRERLIFKGTLRLEDSIEQGIHAAKDLVEAEISLVLRDASAVEITIQHDGYQGGTSLRWDQKGLHVDEISVPKVNTFASQRLQLRVFLDRSLLEAFVNSHYCITKTLRSGGTGVRVGVRAIGGSAQATCSLWQLSPVWPA